MYIYCTIHLLTSQCSPSSSTVPPPLKTDCISNTLASPNHIVAPYASIHSNIKPKHSTYMYACMHSLTPRSILSCGSLFSFKLDMNCENDIKNDHPAVSSHVLCTFSLYWFACGIQYGDIFHSCSNHQITIQGVILYEGNCVSLFLLFVTVLPRCSSLLVCG